MPSPRPMSRQGRHKRKSWFLRNRPTFAQYDESLTEEMTHAETGVVTDHAGHVIEFRDTVFGTVARPASEDEVAKPTFREWVRDRMESLWFHRSIIALIALDALIVIAALIIEFEKAEREEVFVFVDQSRGPSCINVTDFHDAEEHGCLHEEELESHAVERLKEAAEVLRYSSLAILSIFLIEAGFKIFALRWDLLHHKLEIFDMVVVLISWCLELFLEEEAAVETGFLILLRLWRVTRIINGVAISLETHYEDKLKHHKKHRWLAEEHVKHLEGILEHYVTDSGEPGSGSSSLKVPANGAHLPAPGAGEGEAPFLQQRLGLPATARQAVV